MGQFLGPQTNIFRQFLVPIVFSRILATRKRKKHVKHAWIIYDLKRNQKSLFKQKLAHFKNFWIQKLTLWARDTITI